MSKVVFTRTTATTHRGLMRLAASASRRLGRKVTVQDVAGAAFGLVLAHADTGALAFDLDGATFTITLARPARVAIPRKSKSKES